MSNAERYAETMEALTGTNPLVTELRRLLREATDQVMKERAEVARLRCELEALRSGQHDYDSDHACPCRSSATEA